MSRDHLLRTAYRLNRSREFWDRRVKSLQTLPLWIQNWGRVQARTAGDRARLAYAAAAYQTEVYNLGKVLRTLRQRPVDMSDGALLEALRQSEMDRKHPQVGEGVSIGRDSTRFAAPDTPLLRQGGPELPTISPLPQSPPELSMERVPRSTWSISQLRSRASRLFRKTIMWESSQSSARLWPGQKSDKRISGQSATKILLAGPPGNSEGRPLGSSRGDWKEEARLWSGSARIALCDLVRETRERSALAFEDEQESRTNWKKLDTGLNEAMDDILLLEQQWARRNYGEKSRVPEQWRRMVHYVDHLGSWRRTGEDRSISVSDLLLLDWSRGIDFFGIPSTILALVVAHWVHAWIKPRWPEIREESWKIIETVRLVLVQRVWTPIKGIWDDLTNRSEGMSGLSVEEEQVALDGMLRDMGFGDGSVNTRREALAAAAARYQKDLDSGVLRNFLRGELVRLLLVQVQQLKVSGQIDLEAVDAA
jgi:ATP synthase regulation protein NCA2